MTAGRPGLEWDWTDMGIGIDGSPSIWKALVLRGNIPGNVWWDQVGPSFQEARLRLGQVDIEIYSPEKHLFNATREKYEPYKVEPSPLLPPLNFTWNQMQRVNELGKAINSYVNGMTIRFITGEILIERGWAEYLQKLEQLGIEEYLGLYREAYEAYIR